MAAIGKPFDEVDKVFRLAQCLGSKYATSRTAMLCKPLNPSMNQFIIALQNHEHAMIAEKEEKSKVDHNEAFFG